MIVKSPAKINLEFEILGKREDGYHDIRTVMQTVDLNDYLEIEKSEAFSLTGTMVAPPRETTIYKAMTVMEETFAQDFPISVHLDKMIPVAAGMGGGSSDAAAVLYAINELYELKVSKEELQGLAGSVGADVPFFIVGGKCLCEGFGEKVTQLPADEEPGYYIIFRPHKRVSTKQAYYDYDRVGQQFSEAARIRAPQLDDIFDIFPDAVISGKGPTAFVFRSMIQHPELPAELNRLIPTWDGDIYVARPIGR